MGLEVLISEEKIHRARQRARKTDQQRLRGEDGAPRVCAERRLYLHGGSRARDGHFGDPRFLAVSSYNEGTSTSGEVRLTKDLDSSLQGRDVIIVEDIADTGLTLRYLYNMLQRRGPNSLKIAALLSKPSRREVEVPVDYVGFEIPDRFVVGYGLDVDQKYRNLRYIAVVDS